MTKKKKTAKLIKQEKLIHDSVHFPDWLVCE